MIDTNKIFYILLSIVLVIAICIGLNVYINWRNSECEYNNQKIIDFTVELVKGNKSIEDINSTDFPEKVKNSFLDYYNNNFIEDNSEEVLKLYDSVSYFNSVIPEIKEKQVGLGDSFFTDKEGYAYSIAVNESGEDIGIDERYKFVYLNYSYVNEDKTSNGIYEKEDCLYIKKSEVFFDDSGKSKLYYKGLLFNVYLDDFDKCKRSDRQKDYRFNMLEYFNVFEESKNNLRYCYKSKSNLYDCYLNIYTVVKFNKISEVRIEIQK